MLILKINDHTINLKIDRTLIFMLRKISHSQTYLYNLCTNVLLLLTLLLLLLLLFLLLLEEGGNRDILLVNCVFSESRGDPPGET